MEGELHSQRERERERGEGRGIEWGGERSTQIKRNRERKRYIGRERDKK